jgi:hypothetical protein
MKPKRTITARIEPELYELILKEGKGKTPSEKIRNLILKGLNVTIEHNTVIKNDG